MEPENQNYSEAPKEETKPEPQSPESSGGDSKKRPVGPMVGVAIIVVIIMVGGLYFLSQRSDTTTPPPSTGTAEKVDTRTPEDIAGESDDALRALQEVSESDEISDIEADLNLTNLENLDADLGNIDTELNF